MNELRCQDLFKSYGGVKVLQGVHLRVGGGEILGQVHANGAGNSTLIEIVSGQLGHDSGNIYLGETLTSGAGTVQMVIRQLAASGIAVVISEPSIRLFGGYLDRGYVLISGRISAPLDGLEAVEAEYLRLLGMSEPVATFSPVQAAR